MLNKLFESELGRYIVAGIINNLIGYGAFLLALHGLNAPAHFANAIAYAVGLQGAFLLNRFYVFKNTEITKKSSGRFLFAFALSFALNQITLQGLIRLCNIPAEISQILAMAVYMVVFYLLNKYLVWSRD